MAYAIGVDIGGTKIATAVIDHNNKILHRVELHSIADDKEKMFEQVVKSINLVLLESEIPLNEIRGMGVGVPGKVDKQNGIAVYQNNLPWHDFPLVERLREHYQIENIRIDNDVYIATSAEWKVSGLGEEDAFVYITVSTGVSCAIIHQGEFIRGAGFAGEIGLFPVIAKSFPTGWNRLEKTVSGPAIECTAREKLSEPSIIPKKVFQKYNEGCSSAIELVNHISESLAHGIYSIICLLDPHKIVFGGGVMNNNPYLLDLIKHYLKQYIIPEQQHTLQRLHVSHFKENAGVVGAGLLGLNNEER